MQHLYFFVAPEYMFALSKDNNFKTITDNNVSADGFAVHAGLLVNFRIMGSVLLIIQPQNLFLYPENACAWDTHEKPFINSNHQSS